MSDPNTDWNPADGPPPTDDEREDARALTDALAGVAPTKPRDGAGDPDFDALVATALRVRATAHPDPETVRAAASAAVTHALASAGPRWYRGRWRWLAAAAAVLLGVGGAQVAVTRAAATDEAPSISRAATDVFSARLPDNAGSMPISRIADARLRAYRDVLFRAPASGAARGGAR